MTDLEAIPTDELIREMLRVNEAYKWSPLFVRREVGRRLAAAEAIIEKIRDIRKNQAHFRDGASFAAEVQHIAIVLSEYEAARNPAPKGDSDE